MLERKESAAAAGVPAPWNAPSFVWRYAWKFGAFFLRNVLHRWDDCEPEDTKVNLSVLWWKAISGNRPESSDGSLAFDLLPPVTRRVVGWPLCRLYPNLHHANVAIR